MNNIEIPQSEKPSNSSLMEFMQDSLRKTSQCYIAWLVIGLFMAVFMYFFQPYFSLTSIRLTIFVYYIIAMVHVALRLKTGGRANILAPDIIFLAFYTLFHLGYVTLYALNLVPYVEQIFFYKSSVPRALLVVNLGLVGFLFGYELLGYKYGKAVVQEPIKIPTRNWCAFGMTMMTIGVVMHVTCLAVIGITELTRYGYGAISHVRQYYGAAMGMFASESNTVVLFGTTIYLAATALRYRKLFRSKVVLVMILGMFFLYVIEGDRGPILYLGIPVLLVRHYFIKRIRICYLALFFVIIAMMFGAIGVVRREIKTFDPLKQWQEYGYQRGAGRIDWRGPFVEMGGSFRTTVMTCQEVPSVEPYWMGKSYLSAALHIIPFLEGFCVRRGWLGPYSYWPSKWVTETFWGRGRGGLAFTVATEGYLNFGLPGAFFELVLCGLFVRWITLKFSEKPSAAWAFIMLCCFVFSIAVIRNHIQLVTGWIFQTFVIAGFVSWLCKNEPELEAEYFEIGEDSTNQLYEQYYSW